MPLLLAIETSAQFCSVALYLDGKIENEVIEQPQGHSKYLLSLVDRQLLHAGICLGHLDGIAVSAGPGSFTGLRIGMGVVQGLAFGAKLPVIPVSTLQVLAQRAIREGLAGNGELILPILDARMQEVYWGLYLSERVSAANHVDTHFDAMEVSGQGLARALINDQVAKPQLISDIIINSGHVGDKGSEPRIQVGIGDGWCFAEDLNLAPVYSYPEAQALAIDIFPLALEKLVSGETLAPEALEPFYIRKRIHWQKRERLR